MCAHTRSRCINYLEAERITAALLGKRCRIKVNELIELKMESFGRAVSDLYRISNERCFLMIELSILVFCPCPFLF